MAYAFVNDILAKLGFANPSPDRFGGASRAITASDTADFTPYAKAVVTLAAGNISVVPARQADDTPVPFVGVAAGFIPPFTVRRVMATGTSVAVMTVDD